MTNELALQLLETLERIEQRLSQIEKRIDANEQETFLSPAEAAGVIGISRMQCIRYINSGKLPAQQPGGTGGEYKIRLSDIVAITRSRAPKNGYMNKPA